MLRLLRQVGLRELRASWGRTALVIGGVSAGVALIAAIQIINESVLRNFRDSIELVAGPAQLEVTQGIGEIGFPDSSLDLVRADPDVAAAIPLVRGTLGIADRPGETLQLLGLDLTAEADLQRYRMTLESEHQDHLEWLADVHSIALPAPVAAQMGLGLGSKIRLATTSGVALFTVRGLLEPSGIARAFGGQLAIMDLPAAQLLLEKRDRIDQIDIVVRPGAAPAAVADRLRGALPQTLTIQEPAQRGTSYQSIFGSFQAMVTGLSLLCLVAGLYIIYNTTSTGVLHRALVYAGLRVIGADARQLFRMLMLEAIVVSMVGTALGLANGIALAWLLCGLVSQSMGVIFQLRFPVEALDVDARSMALTALVGIAAGVFASYFAARRVSLLEPLVVMRAEPWSLAGRSPSLRLTLIWVVLVLLSAAALICEIRYHSIAWGNVGSTLWFASTIVIAVPIVNVLAAPTARLLTRLWGAEGRVAAESLFRSPTRTGVTVAAIALVFTIAVMFASVSYSHRRSVSTYFTSGFLASDLAVSAVTTEGGWLETPLPAQIEQELGAIPGVATTATLRIVPGVMYGGQRIAVASLSDVLLDPSRFSPGWFRAGDPVQAPAAVRDGAGLLISVSFAERFGKHVGDVIEIATPTGPLHLPVVGVVPDYISDRGSVAVGRRVFEQYWQDSTVSWFFVFTKPDASRSEVQQAIRRQLGDRYLLKVLAPSEGMEYLAGQIDRAYQFTYAIQLLVIIVTVAGIFDLLVAAIWERRRELALWRVIGADDRTVHRSVVIESVTVGVVGAVLGLVLGAITTWIWVGINYRYLLGYYIEYAFDTATAARLIALIIGVTIVVGYGAARQATRQSVLAGIQVD